MWFSRCWAQISAVSFGALTASALSLSLYSPPAACGNEAGGSEESEAPESTSPSGPEGNPPGLQVPTAGPSKETLKEESEVLRCKPKPPWWSEEARICVKGVAGPGQLCEDHAERRHPKSASKAIASTAIGTSAGVVVGFTSGVAICLTIGGGGEYGVGCIAHPVTAVTTVLGVVGGGYFGYKNNVLVLPIGGAMLGATAGLLTSSAISNASGPELLPIMVLSTTAGGYLGYRLWRSGETSEPQASLSPYLHEEGSGFILSGRF